MRLEAVPPALDVLPHGSRPSRQSSLNATARSRRGLPTFQASAPFHGHDSYRNVRTSAMLPAIAEAATVVVLASMVFVSRPCRPM